MGLLTINMAGLCAPPPDKTMAAGEIQLIAVQMKLNLEDYWSPQSFERKVSSLMEELAPHLRGNLPTLVAFPEDVGLMLVLQGMRDLLQDARSTKEAISRAVRAHLLPVIFHKLLHRTGWASALILHRWRAMAETYLSTFSRAARIYGVYIAAGSIPLPAIDLDGLNARVVDHRIYNTAYLFDPSGGIVGTQRKVHLIDLEGRQMLGLTPSQVGDIKTFKTELGTVGIAICLDAFQEDVLQALSAQGAQILVQPSANPGPWTREQQEDWLNSSYKATHINRFFTYAVNPMMTGKAWDLEFYGQSSIITSEHTPSTKGYKDLGPMEGFLRVASSDGDEEILVARVPRPDFAP